MHALTAPLSELAEIEEICEECGREPACVLRFRVCDITENAFDVCAWKRLWAYIDRSFQ